MTRRSGPPDRPAVHLRPAAPADAAFFRRLYASTRAEELAALTWDEATRSAFVDHQFAAQTVHYATHYAGASVDVVLLDGALAGRLYVYRGAEEIRIVDIALVPAARGLGAGSSLLGELMREARRTGRMLTIHVEKHNRARRLYQRIGFEERSDRGAHVFMVWDPAAVASGESLVVVTTGRHAS